MNPDEIKEEAPKKGKTKGDEAITMSREEFSALIKREVSDALAAQKPVGPITLAKRVKEHTLTIREFDGKYVIGLKMDRYKRVIFDHTKNEKGEPDMIVTALLLGADGEMEERKIFYNLDFHNNSRQVTCPISSTRIEETIETQGITSVTKVEPDGYKTIDTGYKVPVEVLTEELFHTIKLPDNREVEIAAWITNS